MTEAAERWSACSIATAAWPRTWRQPADRGVSWRSQGRWRRARPHRPNSETGSEPPAHPRGPAPTSGPFRLYSPGPQLRQGEVSMTFQINDTAPDFQAQTTE